MVYCNECNDELSRTKVDVPATGHNYVDNVCTNCGGLEKEHITVEAHGIDVYDSQKNRGYSVNGDKVTVKFSVACRVAYWNDEKYVAIEPVENADGSYSYTAPEGVSMVVLVVEGDVNGDGKLDDNDKALYKDAIVAMIIGNEPSLEAWQIMAADINNDGIIDTADMVLLARSVLARDHTMYRPLSWRDFVVAYN